MTYLMHYGVKGMKWGIKNGPPYPIHSKYLSPNDLLLDMGKHKYREYSRLQEPSITAKRGGSCHDQVMLELQELRRMGLKPKAKFLMEYNDNGQGGMTHSFVYFKSGKKTYWFENAWGERAGITPYNSINDIKKEIRKAHKTGEYGNIKKYPHMVFTDFHDEDHKYGETLQEFVDHCFKRG